MSLLHSNSILIACLQETKLSSNSLLRPFPSYTTIRQDRPGSSGGGGLITLVHHSISYKRIISDHLFPSDQTTEHLVITATINNIPINIYNIYIPPSSSCPPNFSPSLQFISQAQDDSIILGDFNAHHLAWYSQTSDSRAAERGELIHNFILDSDLALLNTDTPSLQPACLLMETHHHLISQ